MHKGMIKLVTVNYVLTILMGCLYVGEPARVSGLARFGEMNFRRVASPVSRANLFTSFNCIYFPAKAEIMFFEIIFSRQGRNYLGLAKRDLGCPCWPGSHINAKKTQRKHCGHGISANRASSI